MARKESHSNQWRKTDRVGEVTLFITTRSPYWQMYWMERPPQSEKDDNRQGRRLKEHQQSTRETDLALARLVAVKKSEELFKQRTFPEMVPEKERPVLFKPVVDDFVKYLDELQRNYDHIKNIRGRLGYLTEWMKKRNLRYLQDITPDLLRKFTGHLLKDRGIKAATANSYLDAVHNFFGYVLYKRRLMVGSNPAATGRQAVLDRLPVPRVSPPMIYPDQVNRILEVADRYHDRQIIHLMVFACEGGFRFQEMQFLQVGDIHLDRREIRIDVKKPDPRRVRMELRKRCLTHDGLWIPKTQASRRPVHITDRMARLIGSMGLGEPSDWLFVNLAGNQIQQNKTLNRLKKYGLEADVLVDLNPRTGKPWSLIRWHWLRRYHRSRVYACGVRREVSKLAMGHAADAIHDLYRGMDEVVFHEEYAKFDSGLDDTLLDQK